ncbi:MAG TPA: dephospho-CoA kinase [Candidatus Cloacimonadota bacterium]|nr:dephospho-CoA kinase [Candidatus Cloacimonadota bacterium]
MPQSSSPKLIGITGNIGSGKSLVCSFIQQAGFKLVPADDIAKAQLDDEDLQVHLAEVWGAELIVDGRIDRNALADIVFTNPGKLAYLNSLIHPRVLEIFDRMVEVSHDDLLFFEIPLLFEAGLESCFDAIVLVTAPREQVIARLKKRDSSSPEQILARLKAQIPDIDKLDRVDYVLQNDSDPEALKVKTLSLLERLKTIASRPKIGFIEACYRHNLLHNNG